MIAKVCSNPVKPSNVLGKYQTKNVMLNVVQICASAVAPADPLILFASFFSFCCIICNFKLFSWVPYFSLYIYIYASLLLPSNFFPFRHVKNPVLLTMMDSVSVIVTSISKTAWMTVNLAMKNVSGSVSLVTKIVNGSAK